MNTCIIVCGSPGAGKTTWATRVAAARHAALLDIDTVTERLVRLALAGSGHDPDDRDSAFFKQTYRQAIYDTLFAIARENLAHQDVVITGPFTREIRNPDWPSALQELLGSTVEVHYVYCDPKTRRRRLERRANARDRAKLEDWAEHVGYYGDESPPAFEHRLVDGTAQADPP